MKKLFFLFALLAMVAVARAQTGTVEDHGSYIQINYPSGDTVSISKENIVLIKPNGDDVYLMTSHNWRSDRITKIVYLDYEDFGYASTSTLHSYLSAICFRAYTEVYSYDNGNLDTVSYYYGATLQYQVVYGYTDALVTSKSIITP